MEEPNILIKTALNEAVQKINEGLHPTEALKKVANDLDLNPNYIQRTGEALNVALHYRHFKTASDRSADFEIADIPEAVKSCFDFTEKTASEQVSEWFPSNEVHETVFNYNRMLSNPVYKQAFLEIANAPETNDYYPTTFKTVYEKSANYIDRLVKQAEDAAVAQNDAEFRMNSTFASLAQEFRKTAAARTSFEEFESQVYSKHGEASLGYLDLLHKTSAQGEERGVHDSGYIMFEQCKEAQLFDSFMKAAADWLTANNALEEAQKDLSFESSYLKEAHKLLGKSAGEKEEEDKDEDEDEDEETEELEQKSEEKEEGEDEDEDEDPVMAQVKKKVSNPEHKVAPVYTKDPVLETAQEKEKEASEGRSLTDMFVGSVVGGIKGVGGLIQAMSGAVHKPATEAFMSSFHSSSKPLVKKPNLTLENMERKLLLQELMLTDPILSKVSPAKVARAFEQILRISPEISKEKEVVRAELRAMVSSQALSKYDADIMAKLDTTMLKRRALTQAFNAGDMGSFRF